MIYATNNCCVAEEIFWSGLGSLTLFRERAGFGRSHASGRVRAWAGPDFRRISGARAGAGPV